MYVTLMMDVEDLVSPDSDDAARDCAEILTREGLQATMCVVGEKARLLRARRREDVIDALKRHDIGLHTDLHSVPPTVAEYLSDKGWDDGVAEAVARERPGADSIRNVFGTEPSCWGGPGNTWGPQICGALQQIGVPAFVYSYTAVPDGNPHRFAGVLAYPGGRSLGDGLYHDDTAASERLGQLVDDLQRDSKAGLFWREVFVGHPTRIMHEEFWDGRNFADGAKPPREAWTPAKRKPEADYRRALANFRHAVCTLRELPGIEITTIREMNARLSELRSQLLPTEEAAQVWPGIEESLRKMAGWPILPKGLDMDRIVEETRQKLNTLRRIELPRDP